MNDFNGHYNEILLGQTGVEYSCVIHVYEKFPKQEN